mmetsp:Transcript_30398/g.78822  ORF Transcript_30398/g.78822 Transcript_30398/m.78822 type:complete len:239 (+) Transcript_30398:1434-2150(+)
MLPSFARWIALDVWNAAASRATLALRRLIWKASPFSDICTLALRPTCWGFVDRSGVFCATSGMASYSSSSTTEAIDVRFCFSRSADSRSLRLISAFATASRCCLRRRRQMRSVAHAKRPARPAPATIVSQPVPVMSIAVSAAPLSAGSLTSMVGGSTDSTWTPSRPGTCESCAVAMAIEAYDSESSPWILVASSMLSAWISTLMRTLLAIILRSTFSTGTSAASATWAMMATLISCVS